MPYINRALALPQEDLEKMSNSDEKFTFLHSVARHTRDPQMLRDQLVAVLLAGRDTTAATLSWAFYELCRYPEKYQRLRREVLDALGGSRNRKPGYEDLKGMAYLRHTLNETLRLYPAVPYNLRAALEDTTLPPGVGVEPGQQPEISVVEGDIVIYSALAMQRRPDLYPPVSETFADPAVFSPERWETWTPKPWHHVPFNGGPRICVGQNFAMTEMAYCSKHIPMRSLPLIGSTRSRAVILSMHASLQWFGSCRNTTVSNTAGTGMPRNTRRRSWEGRAKESRWPCMRSPRTSRAGRKACIPDGSNSAVDT